MDQEAAFIQAITVEPRHAAPRLIYADWLEERGRPAEATFLRTEWELAHLSPEAAKVPSLRTRLWEQWGAVGERWLHTFTQPRIMLANPTEFPSLWLNFGLETLRPARGTYDGWAYDSLPHLVLDELPDELRLSPLVRRHNDADFLRYAEEFTQSLDRAQAEAVAQGVRLPDSFVRFMRFADLRTNHRSVTGCYFIAPNEYAPVRASRNRDGVIFPFYSDSQSRLVWELYLHRNGGHCVIAGDPEFGEEEGNEPAGVERPAHSRCFVAPSFEAFVYRVWLENRAWCQEHADYMRRQGNEPPAPTPDLQAYLDHYRTANAGGAATG